MIMTLKTMMSEFTKKKSCQPKHAKAKDGVDLDLLSKRILSLLQTKKVDRVSVATAHNGSSARKTVWDRSYKTVQHSRKGFGVTSSKSQ